MLPDIDKTCKTGSMTAIPHARLVLQDVLVVRENLENEKGAIQWRLYWVLAVVLLRAVGHVLDKVDGRQDKRVAQTAKELFAQWKTGEENAIFRDFIELERNNILKEYEISITEGPIPLVAHLQNGDGFDVVRQFLIEENLYRPISGGTYDGEDGRTLLDEAIDWWRIQLDKIDASVSRPTTSG